MHSVHNRNNLNMYTIFTHMYIYNKERAQMYIEGYFYTYMLLVTWPNKKNHKIKAK